MKIALYCGERLFSWRRYPLIHILGADKGFAFSIGPILFWDGS